MSRPKVPLVILGVPADLFGASALSGGLSIGSWGLSLLGCASITAALVMFVWARPPDPRNPQHFQLRVPVLVFFVIFVLLGAGAVSGGAKGDTAQLLGGAALIAVALVHAPFVFARNRYSGVVLQPAPPSAHDALPTEWFDR